MIRPKISLKPLLGATAALSLTAGLVQADIVHLDDVIIDGSLCVGIDCVNGESFGFDTIRLKENNLRIKFDDTSNSASFPDNDWQLTANDSSNGGQNKFSINDISNNRVPFTIEAPAPSNALYVADNGALGLGTSTPVVDIHAVSGNTPTLRLEQDGSSGFSAQTWDVAGNEANFFIRDVTGGSRLPFRIQPGAPSNAIYIANDGDIGMGTTSPSNELHIQGGTGQAAIRLSPDTGTNGAVVFKIQDVNGIDEFRVSLTNTAGAQMRLTEGGDLIILGELTTSGSCSSGCDRVFSDSYMLRSISEHAKLMWENNHLPAVGPTNENGPMNISAKMGGMLNELEHAHIYIDQLNQRIAALESILAQTE